MEIATSNARRAADGHSAVSAVDPAHRGALLRYATRMLEEEAPAAPGVVEAVFTEDASGEQGAEDDERRLERRFATCRRLVVARLRHAGREARAAVEQDEPAGSLAEEVGRLTPKQREVVWLRFSHGFGDEAVARIAGLSRHNVGFLLHSALSHLVEAQAGRKALAAMDDPRVSAYVLEEMEPEERAAFTQVISQEAVTRMGVETVQRIVRELSAALDDGRERKRQRGGGGAAARGGKRRIVWLGAVVAGVILAGGAGWWWMQRKAAGRDSAAAGADEFHLRPDEWKLARASEGTGAPGPGRSAAGGSAGATREQIKPVGVVPAPRPKARREDVPPDVRGPVSGNGAGAGTSPEGSVSSREAAAKAEGAGEPAAEGVPRSEPAGGGENPEAKRGGGARKFFNEASGQAGAGRAAALSAVPSGAQPAAPQSMDGARADAPPAEPEAKPNGASAREARSARKMAERAAAVPGEEEREPVKAKAGESAFSHWQATKVGSVAQLLAKYSTYETQAEAAPGITVEAEVAAAPWDATRRLVRVVVSAAREPATRPAESVVLLVDVSASMAAADRLPLVQTAARRLLRELRADDRVAVVAYAAEARMVLPPTLVTRASEIMAAVTSLRAEGATNGGEGLRCAYEVARSGWVQGGVNRVVWCTDGDFNVGVTSEAELAQWVTAEAASGVTLAVIGFGRGRQVDARLESLAALGRGRGGYANTPGEAEAQMVATSAVATRVMRDVRVELDCDPARVAGLRLVGAGDLFLTPEATAASSWEVGALRAGESRVALFELVPRDGGRAGEVGVRWERAADNGAGRTGRRVTVRDAGATFAEASAGLKFSAAVAGLGLALRDRPPVAEKLRDVVRWAESAALTRGAGRETVDVMREEFLALAREAQALAEAEAK